MDAPTAPLLAYLQKRLALPGLAYAMAPAPIPGGYDTLIYGFELAGASSPFAGPLIVRIFRDGDGPRRAAAEAATQNAVAATGYPAPPVIDVCVDNSVLGGAFTIMPRIPGITLLSAIGPSAMLIHAGPLLAKAHAKLHAIDARPFAAALDAGGVQLPHIGAPSWLAHLGAIIEANDLEGMRAGFAWLDERRPTEPPLPAILHLDFHPANVLVEHGAVSGVIDWGAIALGEPAADVAGTLMTLTMGPLDVSPWARPLLDVLRRFIARRYLSAYRKERTLPEPLLRYFDAAKCFTTMTHAAAIRAANARGESTRESYAWSGGREVRRITARFKKLTGVTLVLPP